MKKIIIGAIFTFSLSIFAGYKVTYTPLNDANEIIELGTSEASAKRNVNNECYRRHGKLSFTCDTGYYDYERVELVRVTYTPLNDAPEMIELGTSRRSAKRKVDKKCHKKYGAWSFTCDNGDYDYEEGL